MISDLLDRAVNPTVDLNPAMTGVCKRVAGGRGGLWGVWSGGSGATERPARDAAVTARLQGVIPASRLLTELLQPEVEVDVNVH